jgi:hypothetical protein
VKALDAHDVVVTEVARRLDDAGVAAAAALLRQTLALHGTPRERCFDDMGRLPADLAPAVQRLRDRETWEAARELVQLDGVDGAELDPWRYIEQLAAAQGCVVADPKPLVSDAPVPEPAPPSTDRAELLNALARVAHLEALLDQLAPRWRRSPAEEAAAFNARAPGGTRERYWRGVRQGPPSGEGTVRHPAVVMSDHASVWITGCVGSMSLSHVEVVS